MTWKRKRKNDSLLPMLTLVHPWYMKHYLEKGIYLSSEDFYTYLYASPKDIHIYKNSILEITIEDDDPKLHKLLVSDDYIYRGSISANCIRRLSSASTM